MQIKTPAWVINIERNPYHQTENIDFKLKFSKRQQRSMA